MSKYLKKYNEETQKWELVSAPDVSVVQKLEDGSDITDTNVIVTNPNYIDEESEKTTLDQTLTVINDDISRLQRNVSWLAEHGGGGGGGGGGTQQSFGIEIVSPTVVDGAAYVSDKVFEIEFMITGGSDGDICTYSYVYDSEKPTDYKSVEVNKSIKIPIDNTGSPLKEHSIIIRAINPYGTNLIPKTFRIYESTLSLAFDTATAGKDYADGVFNIRRNNTYGYIPFLITNGLMNSQTVFTASYNEDVKSIEFTNETTSPQQLDFSVWDILRDSMIIVGQYYVLTFKTTATLGTNTIESNEVQVRIKIISPTEMTVVMGVNGTTGEHVRCSLNSSLVYNFKVYAPSVNPPIESTYYSAKITKGNESYLILGQYYDEETKIDGKEYFDNPNIAVGNTVNSQYILSSANFRKDDEIELHIKVWNVTGDRTASALTEITVIKESDEIFPRQSNTRGKIGSTGNTVFLAWDKFNASHVNPFKWTSTVEDYAFIDSDLAQSEGSTVIADMNVFNANNSSGVKVNSYGTPYLRLQNRAYATADLSRYANEIGQMTGNENDNYGFTVSFTFKQDTHNDTNHTLLLWGTNSPSDGSLSNGIRIDTDKVYWMVQERTEGGSYMPRLLSCPITSKVYTTIDFSYVKTANGTTARIYINGVSNAAASINIISPRDPFPNQIYFGTNFVNDNLERFSDLDIYEFSVYTRSLNDLQTIVNGKNARFTTLDDYNDWKTKNFITAKATDIKIPESVFFDNGDYITDFDSQKINDIAARSSMPTIYLNFGDSAEFTSSYFYDKHVTSETGRTFPGIATYYDPINNRTEDNMYVLVSLQGTSTLGYRIKNLEMKINESFTKDGKTYAKLFQPKKEWFPESQFTLKADVVDSAHANNALLGEWINHSGVFEDNPAMLEFGSNRPIDMDNSGTTYGIDEDVTIKHTLEGFPVLMFIKFSDKNEYTFLGIYSFNLGRYSYYNMGMKFLRGFSRRDNAGNKVACPKKIEYYEEMENLGPVLGNNVYSFELGNGGNGKVALYPVWSQYEESVVRSYGDFKYPSEVPQSVWNKLCSAFRSIAEFKVTSYHGEFYSNYDGIKRYQIINDSYVPVGDVDQQNEDISAIDSTLGGYLHVHNAMGYFVIANAFGMTDSLGKNLTLRTWDGGNTWYCCFYDMDTALGLANDGSENNPVTVAIDSVKTESNPETRTSVLVTTYHDDKSKYAAVLSKIWGVFRDDRFFYLKNHDVAYTYEYIWGNLRKIGGKLSKASNFTDLMAERVNSCGEIVYDYDYNTKYIQDTAIQTSGDYEGKAAIDFLHGTRVEYVKDWLKKHFYFLDGLFDVGILSSVTFTFDESPYIEDKLTIVASFSSSIPVLAFTAQVSTPSFIGLTVGSDDFKKYYIDEENKDVILYLHNGTSSNAQITIKGSTLLTKFDGLKGGFMAIGSNPNGGEAKSLATFDVSSSNALNEEPFTDSIFGRESSLETLDLSNTRGTTTLSKYPVKVENCEKLLNLDVRNSDVTALGLPSTALQSLKISNSNIVNFTLSNQNIIDSLDFTGCNKMQNIEIDGCDGLTGLSINSLPSISIITIQNCTELNEILISGCTYLSEINILNNRGLKKITIADCTANNLKIKILGSALEEINMSGIWTTEPIGLPEKNSLSAVTKINLSRISQTTGFYYGNNEVETYEDTGDYILDLSPMTSLDGENTAINSVNVKYIRVANNPAQPFDVYSRTFNYCGLLTRVMGHINIKERAFQDKPNFYINHDMRWVPGGSGVLTDYSDVEFDDQELYNTDFSLAVYNLDGEEPEFINDPNYTNIHKFEVPNISAWFSNTACDIKDAYYILALCDEDIVNISDLFAGCQHLETEINPTANMPAFIDINTFAKCSSVTNINGVFRSCKINGYLFEPLLRPLIGNLTEFRNVFSGQYEIVDGGCFFPEGCEITTLEGFNPNTGGNTRLIDYWVIKNLTELSSIRNSFNECTINFDGSGHYDATELFMNNPKLTEIINSFTMVNGFGSLANLFGGYSDDNDPNNHYPTGVTTIAHSFIFASGSHDDTIFDGDDGNGILMPIGNSFLRKIAGSIRYITGSSPGDNRTYNDQWLQGGSTSFTGAPGAIKKLISNFESADPSYPGMDDCNGDVFPYEVLKGCVNLVEFPSLFEGIHNFKNYDAENEKESVIHVTPLSKNGQSIFKDSKKLKNASAMFRNMSSSIQCTLEGDQFKDCELVNIDRIFSGSYIEGKIPFHLFYEEGTEEYTISALTAAQATALGITDDSGTLSDISEGQYSVYHGTFKYPKKTITNMAEALSSLNVSSSMTCYSVTNSEFEKTLCDNENYLPSEYAYVLHGLEYERNNNTNEKVWDKYAYDGSVDFLDRLRNSAVWSRSDIDRNNLPEEFLEFEDGTPADINNWTLENARTYTGYNFLTQISADKFKVKNFLCPADIFRSCVNLQSTDIKMALAGVSGAYSSLNGVEKITGSIGRIPQYIFEPVSEIFSCAGLFSSCQTILPEKWGSSAANLGETYPEGLFSYFTKMEDISSLFSGGRIWKYTQIPLNMMMPIGSTLRTVASLWHSAIWVESGNDYEQLPAQLFNGCGIIQDVSNMLADSRNNSIRRINEQLFTYTNNSRINNCSGFLTYATRTEGTVPTFWKNWTSMNGRLAFYAIVSPYSFAAMKEKITNWDSDVDQNHRDYYDINA